MTASDRASLFKRSHPLLRIMQVLVCFIALALSSVASAQSRADALNQRATAAMCANCHGTDGRVVQGSAIPALAGMPRDYMLLQLKEFKEGARPATVMHQIAKGLSDAQVQAIASYYAGIPR